jgi:hypothetical protein
MDRDLVQTHAQAQCDALIAGDIDQAAEDFSPELKSNLGQFVTLLPLPLTEATVESVEQTGTGYLVVIRAVGENDIVRMQTRWKERDGRPTMVEASHIVEHSEPVTAGEEEPE